MELHKKKCIPCRGDIPPFTKEQIDEYLADADLCGLAVEDADPGSVLRDTRANLLALLEREQRAPSGVIVALDKPGKGTSYGSA
jgi:hypothetical protein